MPTLRPLLTKNAISEKIAALASRIHEDYPKRLDILVVLYGAKPFAEALATELKKLGTVPSLHFIRLESYKKGKTSGKLEVKEDVEKLGGHVLVVEDIVDTGNTLAFLQDYLKTHKGVSSIRICALLNKPARRKKNLEIDYLGFEIPDHFVVGFGLDHVGKYRDLPYIAILEEF